MLEKEQHTVDGSEIRSTHQLRLVDYPIIYKVLFIPGGCLGFLPSTELLQMFLYIFPSSAFVSKEFQN